MRVTVVGLASSIHGEEYYVELYRRLTSIYSGWDNVTVYEEPITKYAEIDRGYDVYFVIHLTGGTSSLAYQLFNKIKKPVVLFASGEHNALASALSARAKLIDSGIKTLLINYVDLDDFRAKNKAVYKALVVADKLSNLYILEVNRDGRVSSGAQEYMKMIGGRVEAISYRELLDRAIEASIGEVEELINDVSKHYIVASDHSKVEKVARITYALLKLVEEKGYDAVSIDCFPLIIEYGVTPCLAVSYLTAKGTPVICEDDFYSLPLMFIARELTGLSGWIANPSGSTRDGYLRFAHCTIGYDLGKECRFVDHFETGRPYAIACTYGFDKVLFGRFTSDYKKLVMYRGRVVKSGFLSENYCRTQLIIETPGLTPDKFYGGAVGNHHVFIVDKPLARKALEVICWWKDWELEWRN